MRNKMPSALSATLTAVLAVTSAHATPRDRVFVASFGNDSNPCTFTSPCRSFQQAVNTVAAGGEVTAIDSAGFGPITVTQSVSITSPPGVEAGIVASGNTAIQTNTASAITLVLRGLTLDGNHSTITGVSFASGGELKIYNCAIRNFTAIGISVNPANPTSLLIANTTMSDFSAGGAAIDLTTSNSGAPIAATIEGLLASTSGFGIAAVAVGSPLDVLISNSRFEGNSAALGTAGSSSSAAVTATFKNVTINQVSGDSGISQGDFTSTYLSLVTIAPPNSAGVAFQSTNNNPVFSDGTNHLAVITGGGTISSWVLQ